MGIRYYVNGKEQTPEEFSAGSQKRLREMLESGVGPTISTDSTFLAGMHYAQAEEFNNGVPMAPEIYRRRAKEAGVNPHGKVYLSGLAAFPGDPEAWVSGKGDVKRICEERGYNCDGAVKVRAARRREAEPRPYEVAEDILRERIAEEVRNDPGLKEKPAAEVREIVKEKVKPAWGK